ncbi:MmcQ/YjbR family DNA-binding protein [Flavobacterium sp. W21_SRS_FM6]|uniref:MmcQ/YjbR family DNA-binding protein n=1 Tax=Flavobacterium sp. W21_SRS_FM6 TaxID=3240268 RepID=UPI003F8E2138
MMESIKSYLLNKPKTSENFPFGAGVSVFKVNHKMFALLSLGNIDKQHPEKPPSWWLNLKCEPQEALMLRDIFPAVRPGYHMNKLHWNTLILDGSIPQGEIERMIDNSFMLVVNNMSKKDQQAILLHL